MALQIIQCDVSKKWDPRCEERKTSSQSWSFELDEELSLLEINCSLWMYKDVSNKLLLVTYLHDCEVNKINIC